MLLGETAKLTTHFCGTLITRFDTDNQTLPVFLRVGLINYSLAQAETICMFCLFLCFYLPLHFWLCLIS